MPVASLGHLRLWRWKTLPRRTAGSDVFFLFPTRTHQLDEWRSRDPDESSKMQYRGRPLAAADKFVGAASSNAQDLASCRHIDDRRKVYQLVTTHRSHL